MLSLVFSLWIFLAVADGGFLDLDEIENVQYSVAILDTPVSYGDKGELKTENVITMVNKFGQKYHCELPVQEEETPAGGDATGGDAPVDIKSLLDPLYSSTVCLIRTKDWWTYEVCFGKKITQYHMENEKPVGAIINLGTYNPDREVEGDKLTYHPEWYTNGTKCDLTGLGRETELRFVCNEQASQEFIGDIFEPKSCEYTIVIHTDKICSVPHLKPTTESVPLGISCKPILPEPEMEKYQLYAQLKAKKAELNLKKIKLKQQKFLNMLNAAPTKKGSVSGSGSGNPDIEKLLADLGSFMDSALSGSKSGVGGESGAGKADGEPDVESEATDEDVEAKVKDDWIKVRAGKTREDEDPTIISLKEKRNELWLKIYENKNLLKKFEAQLHDTETFLQKNMEKELKYDPVIIEKLEVQKKQLEKVVEKKREIIDELEKEEAEVKSSLKKYIFKIEKNREKFLTLLEELRLLKLAGLEAPENYHGVLAKMMQHFYTFTGDRMSTFGSWFDLAEEYTTDDSISELRKFYKFADGEIDNISSAINFITEPEEEEEESDLSGQLRLENDDLPDTATVEKHEHIIKENVKDEFPDMLREAMEELGISEEELGDLDDTMENMEEELSMLLKKLKGAEEDLDSSMRGLKRDGKKSVKKELREDEETEDYDDGKDSPDPKKLLKETKMKLMEIETELDQVEEGLLEKKRQLKDEKEKVEVEFQKMTDKGLESIDELGTKELAKEIETTIKTKLEKMGIKNADKPIEIKVITTNIPLGEDAEDMNGAHVEGMVHNLLYGNQQGYQDIDSQRKMEANYKFSITDELMNKMQKDVDDLELSLNDDSTFKKPRLPSDLYDVVEDDADIEAEPETADSGSLISEIFGLNEPRRRPGWSHVLVRTEDLPGEGEEDVYYEDPEGADDVIIVTGDHDIYDERDGGETSEQSNKETSENEQKPKDEL